MSQLEPPSKKKSSQKFKESYSEEFKCLKKSTLSENHARCDTCAKDFSIAHGGKDDCRRHVNSAKHKEYAVASQKTKDVASFFVADKDTTVIKAECLFTRFIIEHNLPIAVADHAKLLFTAMFPDSQNCTTLKCLQ